MNNSRGTAVVATLIALALMTGTASASDLLGLYVGGSVGKAHVMGAETPDNHGPDSSLAAFQFHSAYVTGWRAFAGARPLAFVGVEAAYADFGSASSSKPIGSGSFAGRLSYHTKQSATSVVAVGYVPFTPPSMDVYAKAGVARLHTEEEWQVTPNACLVICGQPTNRWTTQSIFGAGVQGHFGRFAARLEYEQINARGTDPSLLSVGVLWRF